MKKLISLLTVIVLVAVLATVAFATEEPVLVVDTIQAAAGDEVVVNISIKNNPGITLGEFKFEFDTSALEFVSAAAVGGEGWDWLPIVNDKVDNAKFGTVVFSASADPLTGDCVLVTLTLKVKEGALPGTYPVKAVVDFIGDDYEDFIVSADFEGAVEVLCVDHVAGEVQIENVVAASCSAEGSHDEVTYCTICGEEMSRVSVVDPKLDHTAGEIVVENEVAATCSAEGSYDEVVYCSVCGEELSRETKTTDKLDHTPAAAVKENETEGTCLVKGGYDEVVYCSVCGAEISRTYVETELGEHVAGEPVKENIVGADCVTAGSYDEVVYCTVCGAEISRETKTGELGDHVAGEVVIENEVKGADCKTAGTYDEVVYCTICGAELSRETKEGEFGEHTLETVTTDATCCEAGLTVVKCAICGEVMEETVLPATGEHDYAFEAIDDKDHKVICKNSGKELNVEAHTFGEMIDDPENPGWKYQLCDKCGYKLLDESGDTGDHSMIAVVAATLSMMGIAVVVSKKKEF